MFYQFCRAICSLIVLCSINTYTTAQEEPLRRFLRSYVGGPNSNEGKVTRYFAAFVHLRDDETQQVIVYLSDDGWCGSGGCTMLILEPKSETYRLVTKVMTTRPPIRVLRTKTNDWHDIGVHVQGGGVVHAYDAKLPFNGKSYPISPSRTAQRLTTETPGEIVVPTGVTGEPLYP